MVDFDLKSYTVLYLKNAQEEIKSIRSFISQKSTDFETIHRICHSLKGQSFFMGFNDIGNKALQLEKHYKNLLDNADVSETPNLDVEKTLVEIESLLSAKQV